MKRMIFSVIAAAALAVSSVGAVAAAPPAQASCVAHLTRGEMGPPGSAQREVKFERFGTLVSQVARAPGSSYEECLDAFLEIFFPESP
jgi:hypothetical protein